MWVGLSGRLFGGVGCLRLLVGSLRVYCLVYLVALVAWFWVQLLGLLWLVVFVVFLLGFGIVVVLQVILDAGGAGGFVVCWCDFFMWVGIT